MEELFEISRDERSGKKSLICRIFSVIFWILFTYSASYLIFDAFAPNKTVYFFGLKGYAVQSDSMMGVYNKNDIVFVSAPNFDEIQEGDIITYETYTKVRIGSGANYQVIVSYIVNTHYLARIEQDEIGPYYRTMSYDNFHQNPETWTDPYFDHYYDKKGTEIKLRKNNVLGQAVFSIPWVGNVSQIFQIIFGDRIFVLLIFVDISIYALLFDLIWSDYRESRSKDDVIVTKDNEKS